MPTVAPMAKTPKRTKNSTEGAQSPPEVSGGDAKEEKVTEPVKLRKSFKQKLQLVAEDAGLDMGVLIETLISEHINREYLRVLRVRLAEAEGR